jgi:CheY-like chemotaxis protein
MRLEIDQTLPAPPRSHEIQDQGPLETVVPAEAKSMHNQGIKAAQAGNRPLARMSLQRATEIDPRNESAWLWLASISEYPEELLGFLNHVLDVNPENKRANEWKTATHSLLSKTFVQRGIDACDENQKVLASECFQTALEYNDRNATAYIWLASLSESTVLRIATLEKALAIEPDNEAALAALTAARTEIEKTGLAEAKTAAVAGDNSEAIRVLDDLLSVNPVSIEALTMKSHLADGFDEKIRCFESILAIDPDNLAARSGRDSLLSIFGTAQAAEAESESAVHPDGDAGVDNEAHSQAAPEIYAVEPDAIVPVDEPENYYGAVSSFSAEKTPTEVENDYDTVQIAAEPFATLAEEISEPPANDLAAADAYDVADTQPISAEADYANIRPEIADPGAETIAFSYEEHSHQLTRSDEMPTGSTDELVIPMPDSNLPEARPVPSGYETTVEARETLHVGPESFDCSFCGNENEPQSISCPACMAVLTLSDLELLLSNQSANTSVLRQAVEEMERTRAAREFSVDELTVLGIGHLNLRNLQLGYSCLAEASRMDPNNVVLGGQVNSLLIRLEEIRLQEEAHLKLPRGKSILVVDDSPTVRKLISGKLEKSGHSVICANDGVEAMERLGDLVPDLVLLDITMPRMDGYQVCKNIRSNAATKDVPVVMISGKDGFFDKVRGRMAGTTGYITKPFGPEALMKAVEMYLSGEAPDLDGYDASA